MPEGTVVRVGRRDVPDRLTTLVDRVADASPHNAISFGEQRITYGDLPARAAANCSMAGRARRTRRRSRCGVDAEPDRVGRGVVRSEPARSRDRSVEHSVLSCRGGVRAPPERGVLVAARRGSRLADRRRGERARRSGRDLGRRWCRDRRRAVVPVRGPLAVGDPATVRTIPVPGGRRRRRRLR